MKNIKIRSFSSVVVLAALVVGSQLVSCSIDPNMNNSPNGISQESILTKTGQLALLVGLEASSVGDYYSGDHSRIGSMWTWQMCAPPGLGRPQPTSWDSYLLTSDGPPDNLWKSAYYAVKQANDIINNSDAVFGSDLATTANTVVAMAEWYKALCLGETAALFGDAPIMKDVTNPTAPPTYSTQADVYAEVQRLLSDAVTRFGNSAALKQDLNFKGDKASWLAACHSLKARYFLQIHDYANAYAEAAQGITSAAGSVFAFYDATTAGGYSPWGHWVNDESGNPLRAEKRYIDSLKSEAGDKRLATYFTANAPGGVFVGFAAHGEANADTNETNGLRAASLNKYSGYGDAFPYISYEEVTLIKAECEARGQGGGVSAAVTDVNVIRAAAGLTAFASSDAAATLKEVLKQKWLQLFLEGQAYNDMRRTPEFPLWEPIHNKNYRIIYPKSEVEVNPNVPADDDSRVSSLVGIP